MQLTEINELKRRLDKIVQSGCPDNERLSDIVKKLETLNITGNYLRTTGIALTVNTLRKLDGIDSGVSSRCKTLVKSWKKVLEIQRINPHPSHQSAPQPSPSSNPPGESSSSAQTTPNSIKSSQGAEFQKLELPASYQTGVAVRDSCRKMLASALSTDSDGFICDTFSLASETEEAIYKDFKSDVGQKYKSRVRSRYLNLKDPKNPQLRKSVLHGQISPHRLAIMSAQEMASDEMNKLRLKLNQEAIRDSQTGQSSTSQTDQFKCGKCRKRNCSYYQLQTRSADEPMTTFVTCNECQHHWKFC